MGAVGANIHFSLDLPFHVSEFGYFLLILHNFSTPPSLATQRVMDAVTIGAALLVRLSLSFTPVHDALKYDHLLSSPLTSYTRCAFWAIQTWPMTDLC